MKRIVRDNSFCAAVASSKFFAMRSELFILVITLTALSVRSHAQRWPSELWHEGRIILTHGDTLKGMVKYDLQQDLVQYTSDNKTVEAFTARKILFFEIFDITVHKYRQFFALPYTTAGSYRAPRFFELLEEGKMTLLAREALEYRTYNSPYYLGASYSRVVMVYKYFFLNAKGDITEFTGNKNDLLNLMGRQSEAVEKYIKANRLKYEDKYDFAKIVAYYNSL